MSGTENAKTTKMKGPQGANHRVNNAVFPLIREHLIIHDKVNNRHKNSGGKHKRIDGKIKPKYTENNIMNCSYHYKYAEMKVIECSG